jgi:hypothetical protein
VTQSPFLFRIWRLGFVRYSGMANIGGWRPLFWRFWWDLRIPLPAGRYATKSNVKDFLAVPETLHWRPVGARAFDEHFCGASNTEPWTIVLISVTCLRCIEMAEPLVTQYKTNTR